MTHAAITVENLSKAYRIGVKDEVPDTLASAMSGIVRSPLRNLKKLRRLTHFVDEDEAADTLWALRDVSFEVAEGEVVGVIGRNGAGKSTLLKILSRITEPTSGRAVVRGRVSSLLEVGTGFHPELTGRDNVYMNGTILGMTKQEIDRKFDEIVDFSGVEKFLDTPMKRYSSGMQVRLAFAVAAHLEPEILIIDEVLAVGDAEFQKKCLGKMRSVSRGGRSVLFVSHSASAIQALCDRAILLECGSLERTGSVEEVLTYYNSNTCMGDAEVDLINHKNRNPTRTTILKRVRLLSDGELTTAIVVKAPLTVEVDFESERPPFCPILGVVIRDNLGTPLFGTNNRLLPVSQPEEVMAAGTMRCTFATIPLHPGSYRVDLFLGDTQDDFDIVYEAIGFEILPTNIYQSGKFPSKAAGPFLHDADFEIIEPATILSNKDQ